MGRCRRNALKLKHWSLTELDLAWLSLTELEWWYYHYSNSQTGYMCNSTQIPTNTFTTRLKCRDVFWYLPSLNPTLPIPPRRRCSSDSTQRAPPPWVSFDSPPTTEKSKSWRSPLTTVSEHWCTIESASLKIHKLEVHQPAREHVISHVHYADGKFAVVSA